MDLTLGILILKILFLLVLLIAAGYGFFITLILWRYTLSKFTAIFLTAVFLVAAFSILTHSLTVFLQL